MGVDGSGRSLSGRLATRIYPDIDYFLWRRQRRREIAIELAGPDYHDVLKRRLALTTGSAVARRPHVVVVPQEGDDFDSFRAGTRNLYFEAARNLAELSGEPSVSVFSVHRGEAPAHWHGRLLDYLIDRGATHLLTHIEHDPGTAGSHFSWDAFWTLAAPRWDGVLLGLLFDSAYRGIRAGSKQLARISPRYLVVDICMPMDGRMVRGRPEVGPVNMPVSRQSLALVDERLIGVEPENDVSFIGALYPYRVELIERLRSAGVSVDVNPHRRDVTTTLHESRNDQPEWLDFMAGLRSSRMTINFSRSSAGPVEQLKTRVLEATLARTLLLTDDHDRTRSFWRPGSEFVNFEVPEDLPQVITGLLAEPERIDAIARAGEARARAIAHAGFWTAIEVGLQRRGLPGIGLVTSGASG